MVITIWKESKTLQVVSTTMTNGVGQIDSRNGRDSISVKPPKDIITYQKHMGVVYCGDQYMLIGAGSVNISHFKKYYKK